MRLSWCNKVARSVWQIVWLLLYRPTPRVLHGWRRSVPEGIAAAKVAYPDLKLVAGSAYDSLSARYGHFPVVLSLEVVEHVIPPLAKAMIAVARKP